MYLEIMTTADLEQHYQELRYELDEVEYELAKREGQ